MFSQLKDVYSNTVDNLRNGLRKTGMLFMLGTGGNMEKGTIHSSEMFYEPHRYDILPFDDHWENRGQIGYFLPAYEVLNEFKDSNGISNEEAAKKELLRIRKVKAGDSGGSEALNKEMQYRPIVPSEMFLTKTANIFPTAELRRRLSEVQTQKISEFLEKRVALFFDRFCPTFLLKSSCGGAQLRRRDRISHLLGRRWNWPVLCIYLPERFCMECTDPGFFRGRLRGELVLGYCVNVIKGWNRFL